MHGKEKDKKSVVVIAGEANAVSTVVVALVKGGYAVECAASATDILARVADAMGPCDVLVITAKVSGMRPENLLLKLTETDGGSARRAKVPIVMVVDGAGERLQAQLVAYAENNPAAITTAVDEVLKQCQGERH